MKEIWKTIEEELTGEFARGYALALFLEEYDIKRECKADGELLGYEWSDFCDYGVSSPQEWRDETGYIVCTDEEADARASEYIRESLWAFNTSFLAGQTSLPEEVFSALQPQCESANDAVRRLIESTCGLNSFVEAAIGADGRGNFVASYDHEEHEVQIGTHTFYIYRLN